MPILNIHKFNKHFPFVIFFEPPKKNKMRKYLHDWNALEDPASPVAAMKAWRWVANELYMSTKEPCIFATSPTISRKFL